MQEKRQEKIVDFGEPENKLLGETEQAKTFLKIDPSSNLPDRAEHSREISRLRKSAPIQGFRHINNVAAGAGFLGAMCGCLCSMYYFPQKYLYLIPWPEDAHIMPPTLLAAIFLGMMVGLTIALVLVYSIYSLVRMLLKTK